MRTDRDAGQISGSLGRQNSNNNCCLGSQFVNKPAEKKQLVSILFGGVIKDPSGLSSGKGSSLLVVSRLPLHTRVAAGRGQ